jgi:Retroviral aspartyl protease
MKGHLPVKVYDKVHEVAKAVAIQLKRPSNILAFHLTPVSLPVALCNSLDSNPTTSSELQPSHSELLMKFQGWAKGKSHGIPFLALFDSGLTHTFVSKSLCVALGLIMTTPSIKSVATASGNVSKVLGRVSLQCFWGRPGHVHTMVNAHVLGTTIEGVDIIVGQDWLQAQQAIIDYSSSQCSLGGVHRMTLQPHPLREPDQTHTNTGSKQEKCHARPPHQQVPLSETQVLAGLNAHTAQRALRVGGQAFSIYIKPIIIRCVVKLRMLLLLIKCFHKSRRNRNNN